VSAGAAGYPDATALVTPARLELVALTRRLIDAILTTSVDEDELRDTATELEHIVTRLEARAPLTTESRPMERRHADYLPRSPLVGELNAVAPPFTYEMRDRRLYAEGVFTAAHDGPPGYVHGGWIALAFDEALGIANVANANPGMTARLTIRYRRPTPLRVPLVLEAWNERVEGRRIHTVGTITAGDEITAEAEGIFVNIGAERALEYFGERPTTPEPTDPLP
jgi:acyl-coenzyme A thioesterase PaaI-like protein